MRLSLVGGPATAGDQVKVAASANAVEVAFFLCKWPVEPALTDCGLSVLGCVPHGTSAGIREILFPGE